MSEQLLDVCNFWPELSLDCARGGAGDEVAREAQSPSVAARCLRNHYSELSIEFSVTDLIGEAARTCLEMGVLFFFRCFAGIWRLGWGGKGNWGSKFLLCACQVIVPRAYCLLVNVQVVLCLPYCKVDSLPLAFPTGRCPTLAFTCCILQAVGEFSKC